MKAKLYNDKGEEAGSVELPSNFSAAMRLDILAKTFEAQKGLLRAPYGAFDGAGRGYSASGILKHRRHVWKTTYGKGISRVPRKIMSRHGSSFNWVGATVSNTRGGRRPHAPQARKNLFRKINKKEELIAMNTGFRGTVDANCLEQKYGKKVISGAVFSSNMLSAKTKDFVVGLSKALQIAPESIIRERMVRAGKGKMRGRKYKSNAGILFVISSKENMSRHGLDIVSVKDLLIKDLAPNGKPGRITCYSEEALKEIKGGFKSW